MNNPPCRTLTALLFSVGVASPLGDARAACVIESVDTEFRFARDSAPGERRDAWRIYVEDGAPDCVVVPIALAPGERLTRVKLRVRGADDSTERLPEARLRRVPGGGLEAHLPELRFGDTVLLDTRRQIGAGPALWSPPMDLPLLDASVRVRRGQLVSGHGAAVGEPSPAAASFSDLPGRSAVWVMATPSGATFQRVAAPPPWPATEAPAQWMDGSIWVQHVPGQAGVSDPATVFARGWASPLEAGLMAEAHAAHSGTPGELAVVIPPGLPPVQPDTSWVASAIVTGPSDAPAVLWQSADIADGSLLLGARSGTIWGPIASPAESASRVAWVDGPDRVRWRGSTGTGQAPIVLHTVRLGDVLPLPQGAGSAWVEISHDGPAAEDIARAGEGWALRCALPVGAARCAVDVKPGVTLPSAVLDLPISVGSRP